MDVSSLLNSMTSSKRVVRCMATNVLMSELQKDTVTLDDDGEKKVVQMILKLLLEDIFREVRNLAAECLGPLVSKVKENQVETIVDKLWTIILSGNKKLWDVSFFGLMTVIEGLPSSGSSASVCKKITDKLTSAITENDNVYVQLPALALMANMLCRQGGLLVALHSSILSCLLPQLTSRYLDVRKRTITALCHLAMTCENSLFNDLIEHLLLELGPQTISKTRTHIECMAAISKEAGHRIGEHLEKIIPLVVTLCNVDDDELRERCLLALESFVRKSSKEAQPHIPTVIELCLRYLSHEASVRYIPVGGEDDGDEDDSGEDDSDEDDTSWMVRCASAKCLDGVISTRHEMLQDFCCSVSPALISRFEDKVENVKADVFLAYISLLTQSEKWMSDPDTMNQGDTPLTLLQSQVPRIAGALNKLLKGQSWKTKYCCFNLLTELVKVLPYAVVQNVPELIPGIVFSLNDESSSSKLKTKALSCLHEILSYKPSKAFHPHISNICKDLVPAMVACMADPFYRMNSEALLVTQQLVKVIGVYIHQHPDSECGGFDPYIKKLFSCTNKHLQAISIYQEVNEQAITCMGQIIFNLGDRLPTELPETLPIFLERLQLGPTRLATVKALALIAGSPLNISLGPVLCKAVPILASFLHTFDKRVTLATLDKLLKKCGSSVTSGMIDVVLAELPALIDENDMNVSQMVLIFLTTLVQTHPSSPAKLVQGNILGQLISLVRSPLLQGAALDAMLNFYQALVCTNTAGLCLWDLYKMLTVNTDSPLAHKQAYSTIAKCVAALTRVCPNEVSAVVGQLIKEVKNSCSTDSMRLLALLSLGEVGHHVDLSSQPELKTVITDAFSATNEDVKSAASYALCSIAVGNLPKYLPFILSEISQPKTQYLLLRSLMEIIGSASVPSLKPHIESVSSLLLKHCECREERTRNVVSQCLGKLTLIDPETLLPRLKGYLMSGSPYARGSVVTAVRFTISAHPHPIDHVLKNFLGDFLKTLEDPDLNVRRIAVVTFNTAANIKPMLIREMLDSVLPLIYNETKVREELIREVQMGPDRHSVDDGLDLRKAAFECMSTLLERCHDKLDIFAFLNHLEDGLKDHHDIKMLVLPTLTRLLSLHPSAIIQRLDKLVAPLQAVCTSKLKNGAAKQDADKLVHLKRVAMQAVVSLLDIPEAKNFPLMTQLQAQIQSDQELQEIFDSVQRLRDYNSANMVSMDTS